MTPPQSDCNSSGSSNNRSGAINVCSEEKKERLELKNELKRQRKILKLEKRIRNAIQRKNPSLEAQARMELKEMLHSGNSCGDGGGSSSNSVTAGVNLLRSSSPIHTGNDTTPLNSVQFSEEFVDMLQGSNIDQEETKRFIMNICKYLARFCYHDPSRIKQNMQSSNTINNTVVGEIIACDGTQKLKNFNNKDEQTNLCRILMRQMSKGTQTEDSFRDNPIALWEYTRQKFLERAMLVYTSLSKLQPLTSSSSQSHPPSVIWKQQKMWKQLQKVKHACSLGSGPGNDLVGLVAFLRKQQTCCKHDSPQSTCDQNQYRSSAASGIQEENISDDSKILKMDASGLVLPSLSDAVLQSAIALDWVEEEWRCITEPLQNLLTPNYIQHFTSQSCDITQPLYPTHNDCNDTLSNNAKNSAALACATQCDMFLISYLLTENRGKWEVFFYQLFNAAKKGALFYFAEPTSWQLQKLLQMMTPMNHNNYIAGEMQTSLGSTNILFLWLDSSMTYPKLQGLNGRLGPAVLLGMKI